MKFYYTYILQSQKAPNRFYTGFTEHLESRLKSHNRGENPHTLKYKPWQIKTAIAFSDRQRAIDFEEQGILEANLEHMLMYKSKIEYSKR